MHHYDRLGLLRARRNQTGYRVYTAADLERLELIVALEFIGLPLQWIREVLSGHTLDLGSALRSQIASLEEKRGRLDLIIEHVRAAETALAAGEMPCLKNIFEVITMQNDYEWILRHISPRPYALAFRNA